MGMLAVYHLKIIISSGLLLKKRTIVNQLNTPVVLQAAQVTPLSQICGWLTSSTGIILLMTK
jgi:hypothetical protein